VDAFQVGLAAQSPDRRIVWAGAASAGVHLLLLLTIGVASVESMKPISAPELRVYVESQDRGREDEHDRAGPVEAPAAPTTDSREELLSAAAPSRSRVVGSQPRTVAPPALPAPVTPSEASPSNLPSGSDSPSGEAAVLTTTAPSDSEAPVSVAPVTPVASVAPVAPVTPVTPVAPIAPVAPPAGIDIPAVQRSLLTRWVMQAAEKLRDVNLRQARLSLMHDGRQYVALLERQPAADSTDLERMTVEITTEDNGRRLRTQLEMKRLAFSHFAQLIDRQDPDVQFHDDEIVGRFHSNFPIEVGYDRAVAPRFLSLVTTAGAGFRLGTAEGYRRDDEIFRGGLATRADRIPLPGTFLLPASEAGGGAPGRSFAHDTRITFYPDGSYGWRELGVAGPEHRELMSTPAYIVAGPDAALAVHGTVNGKVLVYSPERIIIEGSLIYVHDPRRTADGGDYLGLLSRKDVEIARLDVTGPGDLEIQAAVYARRRFVVTDCDAPREGTLLIYGSLTAGSLSATEPRYATRYEFDKRFEYERPPGFPMTDRYEIESWDTQWREAGGEPSGASAGGASPPSG